MLKSRVVKFSFLYVNPQQISIFALFCNLELAKSAYVLNFTWNLIFASMGARYEGRKLQMQDIYIFSAAEENDVSTLSTSCGEVAAKIWVISTIWNAKHTDLHNLPMKKNFYIFAFCLPAKWLEKCYAQF